MLSFDPSAAIAAAPTNSSIEPALRQLLADRVHDWAAVGLLHLTHLLVVEAGDTEDDIISEVAFSPLVDLDGRRLGDADFVPPFDWLSRAGGYFEIIQTVGNAGFAFHILVPDCDGVDPELLALCRASARGGE
jgi:hypothetical protein